MSRLPCLLNYCSNHLIVVIKALGFSVSYIKNSQGDLIRRGIRRYRLSLLIYVDFLAEPCCNYLCKLKDICRRRGKLWKDINPKEGVGPGSDVAGGAGCFGRSAERRERLDVA